MRPLRFHSRLVELQDVVAINQLRVSSSFTISNWVLSGEKDPPNRRVLVSIRQSFLARGSQRFEPTA